jgi:ankyrin repeat protein
MYFGLFLKVILMLMLLYCCHYFLPGKHSRTPLMSAAGKGQLEVVELLARTTGINLNAQDSDGLTALMHAAKIGDLEVYSGLSIDV